MLSRYFVPCMMSEVHKKYSNKMKQKINEKFWGITTFFNPGGYKNKYQNYKKFRDSSKKQGLNLLTVELVFGNKSFEIKNQDAEKVIGIRVDRKNILWQKEALLNIALENLPNDCEEIAWLDCDIIFENDNWIGETSELLKKYKIIQPFEWVTRLPKNNSYLDGSPVSFIELEKSGKKSYSVGFFYKNKKELKENYRGNSGFVWAAKKETIKKINGFYDASVLFNGDLFMARAFTGEYINQDWSSSKFYKHYMKWRKITEKEINKKISCTSGNILHLWHGDIKNRLYSQGYSRKIFDKYNFDPEIDIHKNLNGIWEWSSKKTKLHKEIRNYFFKRKEEKSFLFYLKNFIFKIFK